MRMCLDEASYSTLQKVEKWVDAGAQAGTRGHEDPSFH